MNNSWADNEGLLIMNCRMRIIAMLVALTNALAFVGCSHTRSTVMVTVDDLGPQIVTKNKYTLVYGDGAHNLRDFPDVSLEQLIAAHPHVFSSNGIPIVVKHKSGYSSKEGGVPFVIPLITPFILPGCAKGKLEGVSDYTIDVLDCPDAHATFQKKSRDDGCFALISPLPMLFYPTAGSFDGEPKNNCKFTRHFYSFGIASGMDARELSHMSEDATAYGIAALLKQMEDSGKINPAKSRSAVDVQSQNTSLLMGSAFDVVDFHRSDSDSHRYEFSLVCANGYLSLAARRVLSDTIRHDFAASYSSANRRVLAVDFTQYEFANGLIKGSATVLPLNILAFTYDNHTRKGSMRITVLADQLNAARQYVRQNIDSIARDKNIALIVGEIPPDARFELLDESVIEGVLEVKFRTE